MIMEPAQTSPLEEVKDLEAQCQFYRGVIYALHQQLLGRTPEDIFKEVDSKIRAAEVRAEELKKLANSKGVV